MKSVYNQQTFLWIIGVLQPVSVEEMHVYMSIVFKDAGRLPDTDQLTKFCKNQEANLRILRVKQNPDLYSLTLKGNKYLSREYRHSRDKARLFLLKEARKSRISLSREGSAEGLGGVSPSVDTRPSIKGDEANKLGRVVPSGQVYWPRFSKQLIIETGQLQTSRDIPYLPMLSFSNPKQLALASGYDVENLTLDFHIIGLLLGISPRLIVQIVRNPDHYYRSFELKKKGGGTRLIESPRTFLKVIQQFLTDYYLNGLPVHENVQSYRQGRSIITNASCHCGKAYVANLDIENYFGSIRRSEIIELLRTNGFCAISAEIISKLCTKDGVLPQGAPTSPALSNAFLMNFDREMFGQCFTRNLTYTRYADDISISGEAVDKIDEIIRFAETFLKGEYGLRLNREKTRIASKHGQQKVTGVVVNEAPRPPRKFRRNIRAAFNNALKMDPISKEKFAKLSGYLNYLNSFKKLSGGKELLGYRNTLTNLKARFSSLPEE